MLYSSLLDYHKTLNILTDYKYSIADVERMIPFEREIHINLITQGLEARHTTTIEAPGD